MLHHQDNFDRSTHELLDTTAYPVFTGATPRFFGSGDAAEVLRTELTTGIRHGWAMPTPNWAMEVTLRIAAKTDLLAVYLFCRLQTAVGAGYTNYAVVLSTSGAAANHHLQDVREEADILAADRAYLYRYNATTGAAVRIGAAVTQALALDTDYRCRLVCVGDSISFYIDGAEIFRRSDSIWRTAGWGFGTFGIGIHRGAGGSGEAVVDFDDLRVEIMDAQPVARAAYDEARRLVRFSLPDDGAGECTQILNYHLDADAWTREELATSCLGQLADGQGRQQVVYGDTAGGRLWLSDDSATRSGETLECEWQSNWLQLEERKQRVLVQQITAWLATSADLLAEVMVELADDPADPRTWSRRALLTRYGPGTPLPVERTGRFVRFAVRHADAESALALRRVVLGVLE